MKTLVFLFLCNTLIQHGEAQSSGGLEQYHYMGTQGSGAFIPIAHFQDRKGWYAEARYNYEQDETFSLNLGKTFAVGKGGIFSVTPLAGGVLGKLKGLNVGSNVDVQYEKFFFSSEMQYTWCTADVRRSFYFNWSEAGYRPFHWLFTGLSIQHTQPYHATAEFEPGVLAGLSFKNISLPVYFFSPFQDKRYWVAGVSWQWD